MNQFPIFSKKVKVMSHFARLHGLLRFATLVGMICMASGCPATSEKSPEPPIKPSKSKETLTEKPSTATKPAAEAQPSEKQATTPSSPRTEEKQQPKLGLPLVDHADQLKRLDPVSPVWVDVANKQVILIGQVCQTDVPLEMFACLRNTKEHESILVVPVKAYVVHAALLGVGAKAGHPVEFTPKYVPASGTEIDITLHWKDEKGTIQTAAAQDWIRDTKTGKAMNAAWVFGGSRFQLDETTGRQYYQAEGGDFICVSNFSTAMIDLSVESSQANANLQFQAYTERIPPRGTPVTMVLKPKMQ